MRALSAIFAFLCIPLTAVAGDSESYDIYVLACDRGTDCLRVVDVGVARAVPVSEHVAPGVNLRIDSLSKEADAETVRLTVNLTPRSLAFASLGKQADAPNSRINFQMEPCIIKQDRFTVIATFSGGNKIYQVWGRTTTKKPSTEIVATR